MNRILQRIFFVGVMMVCGVAAHAQTGKYKGDLTIDGYTRNGVVVEFHEKAGKVDCLLHKVKFSRFMPVTVDMQIKGLQKSVKAKQTYMTGQNIVPMIKNEPYTKRIVTTFQAVADERHVKMTMTIGDKKTIFVGEKMQ